MPRRYRPSSRALFTDLHDGTSVLLHLDTKSYFELNETATFLWQRLASHATDGLTTEELATLAAATFLIEAEQARPTIVELLDELLHEGLVETLRNV